MTVAPLDSAPASSPVLGAALVDPSSSSTEDALAQAAAEGTNVELPEMRDEYSRTFATPDGATLMTETSTTPIYGRDSDGNLTTVDTTLKEGVNGEIVPGATAVGLVFPTAADPSMSISYDGSQMSFSMPGDVGDPTLDGSSAVYQEVFDGIDLRLTATSDGFQQVYVVKTPEADVESVRQLRFGVEEENGAIVPRSGGGSVFIDNAGGTVFASAPALMWDSAGDAGTAPVEPAEAPAAPMPTEASAPTPVPDGSDEAGEASPTGPGGEDVAEYELPGLGDEVREMPVAVANDVLTVAPGRSFLNSDDTVYPVYIDPMQGIDRHERMMLRSDNYSRWQFDDHEGVGKCPISYSNECSGPYTKRLFYEFGRDGLNRGDRVLRAEFAVRETHAVSCRETPLELHQTGSISSASRWPGPSSVRQIGTRNAAYGREGCPAADIEYDNAALRDAVRKLATGQLGRLTLSLRAGNESDQFGWKRFEPSAVLRVWFVRSPGVPTDVGVHTPSAGSTVCKKENENAALVARRSPEFGATVQTLVQPARNTAQGSLRAAYQIQKRVDGNWNDAMEERYRPSPGEPWRTDDSPTQLDLETLGRQLPAMTALRVRMMTQSYYDIDKVGTGRLDSPWTDWCYFRIDPDAPAAPLIDSADGVYPENFAGSVRQPGGGPGIPGFFTFRPNQNDNDGNITSYRTQLVGPGTTRDTATGVRITPDRAGTYILRVAAIDRLGRDSTERAYQFEVAPLPGPTGQWHFDTVNGTQTSDTSGSATRTLTLSTASTYRSDLGRRGMVDPGDGTSAYSDGALRFTGTSDARTTGPVLNTSAPFSISTAALLTDKTKDRVVVSQSTQDGAAGFDIRYSKANDAWAAVWTYTENGIKKTVTTRANVPAVLNAWTQVSARWDPTTNKLDIVLNGRQAGSSDLTGTMRPTATNGPFLVGRGAGDTPFHGIVDEIEVWNRAVTNDEFLNRAGVDENEVPLFSLVTSWNAGINSTSSVIRDSSALGTTVRATPAPLTLENAVLDTTDQYVVLDGRGGLTSNGPMIDETGAFTVSTELTLDPVAMAGRENARIVGQQAGANSPSWALWFVKTGVVNNKATGVWAFSRWSAGKGLVTAQTDPDKEFMVTLGEEVRLNVVFDPRRPGQEICVSVGADELGCKAYDTPIQGAGELTAGMAPGPGGRTQFLAGTLRCISLWAGAADANTLDKIPSCSL